MAKKLPYIYGYGHTTKKSGMVDLWLFGSFGSAEYLAEMTFSRTLDKIPRYIDRVSGSYGKILSFKEVSKILSCEMYLRYGTDAKNCSIFEYLRYCI